MTIDAQRIATQVGLSVRQVMQAAFLHFASPSALTDALALHLAKVSRSGSIDVVKYHLTKGLQEHLVDASWLDVPASDSGSDLSEAPEVTIISPDGTQLSSKAFETPLTNEAVKVHALNMLNKLLKLSRSTNGIALACRSFSVSTTKQS